MSASLPSGPNFVFLEWRYSLKQNCHKMGVSFYFNSLIHYTSYNPSYFTQRMHLNSSWPFPLKKGKTTSKRDLISQKSCWGFLKNLHIIPCSTFSTTIKFRVRFYKRKITVLSQFIPWCSQYFVTIDNHNKEPNQAHHTPCLFLPFFHHLFPHSWLLQTGRDHRTLACWKKDNDTVNSYLAWIYSQVYKFVW